MDDVEQIQIISLGQIKIRAKIKLTMLPNYCYLFGMLPSSFDVTDSAMIKI